MRCKLKWRREFSNKDQDVVMREYYTIQSNPAKDQHFIGDIEVCDINKYERKDSKLRPTTSVKQGNKGISYMYLSASEIILQPL